jgi:type IV pilus assembly protein PilB
MQGYRRLGELLVARGHLTQEQLDHALALGADRKRFGERLVNLGFVQEHHVTEALAEQFGLPVFDLRSVRPESAAIRLVPYTQAMKALVLPISVRNGRFLCAVSDPLDFPLTDNLETRTGMRVDIGLAPASTLLVAIRHAYGDTFDAGWSAEAAPVRKVRIDPQADRANLLDALDQAFPS